MIKSRRYNHQIETYINYYYANNTNTVEEGDIFTNINGELVATAVEDENVFNVEIISTGEVVFDLASIEEAEAFIKANI